MICFLSLHFFPLLPFYYLNCLLLLNLNYEINKSQIFPFRSDWTTFGFSPAGRHILPLTTTPPPPNREERRVEYLKTFRVLSRRQNKSLISRTCLSQSQQYVRDLSFTKLFIKYFSFEYFTYSAFKTSITEEIARTGEYKVKQKKFHNSTCIFVKE